MDGLENWAIDGSNDHMSSSGIRKSPEDNSKPSLPPTSPQGMDGLQSSGPPPFLNKTYDMVDDVATDQIVSWSDGNNSFIVWNPPEFARDLLPKYFKHNNFSSFVRQLNTYGFRKVDPDRWEFANEGFLRGKRHLLKNIHRRKPVSHHQPTPQQPPQQQPPQQQQQQQQQSQNSTLVPSVEVGNYGLEGEIDRLRKDKNVLMLELVRLRNQQKATETELREMGHRLQVTEQRQQQMMSFLAKAMQNPSFLAQLVQQNEKNKRLATDRKRRRLPKQEGDGDGDVADGEGQIVQYNPASSDNARAMLMQFFNSADLSSEMDTSSPLEALLADIGSTPISQADDYDVSNRSCATLTEMQAPVSDSPALPIDDIPGNRSLNALTLPIGQVRLEDSNMEDREVKDIQPTDSNPRPTSADFRPSGSGLVAANDGMIAREDWSAAGYQAGMVPSGPNDVFWEQYLSGTPGTPDTESEEADTMDSGTQELDAGESHSWWNGKPSVDRLAEQMGQLAPGTKL